jgi:hypothetical protein
MRVADARGNCTLPFEVESDRIRVDGSYFSIVPRNLKVVAAGGADWEAPIDAASSICTVGDGAWANAPMLPDVMAADNSRMEGCFVIIGLSARTIGTDVHVSIKGRTWARI